jgi:hypothetical protein
MIRAAIDAICRGEGIYGAPRASMVRAAIDAISPGEGIYGQKGHLWKNGIYGVSRHPVVMAVLVEPRP